jgi:hypothetical protein
VAFTIEDEYGFDGCFPNGFGAFYNTNGRRAGTYTLRDGRWRRQ